MKPEEFTAQLDDAAVIAEIDAAERKSSGEIRVYVSSEKKIDDPIVQATARFQKLGMHRTKERNGVLLYFAPVVQKFAVIGDTGIHQKCGQGFWEEVAAEISMGLREKKFTPAVVGAVRKVGEVLARHFPRESGDRNELSNEIARD
jgi:uncharacterized membrane protein